MTPEAEARTHIDASLRTCGWVIQDYKTLNLGASKGIAVREVPLKSGRCDYLVLVDRKPVGVVEAKKQGTTLSSVSEQSAHYSESLPDFLAVLTAGKMPFHYESTGAETFFRDERDPHPRSRQGGTRQLAGGKTLAELSAALLRAFDPDVIAETRSAFTRRSRTAARPANAERAASTFSKRL